MTKETPSQSTPNHRTRRRVSGAVIAGLGSVAATLLATGAFSRSPVHHHSASAKRPLTYLQEAQRIQADLNSDKTHRIAGGIALDDTIVNFTNNNNGVSVSNGYEYKYSPIELDQSHDATVKIRDGIVRLRVFGVQHKEFMPSSTDTGSLEVVEAGSAGGYNVAFAPSGEPTYNSVIGAPEPAAEATCLALKMMNEVNDGLELPVDGFSDAQDHIACNTTSSSATVRVTN